MAAKKTVKKTAAKPKQYFTKKRVILMAASIAVPVLVVLGMVIGANTYTRYSRAANEAEMVSVRELVKLAVSGLQTDAALDPKTGDSYLTPAKLYLPVPSQPVNLMYAYNSGSGDVNVTAKQVLNRKVSKLYTVHTTDEMFKLIPDLQACARGITLSYSDSLNDEQAPLQATVRLNNAKTLYMYLDKGCDELKPTVELLKNIRSY